VCCDVTLEMDIHHTLRCCSSDGPKSCVLYSITCMAYEDCEKNNMTITYILDLESLIIVKYFITANPLF
jgi:hypothetical protein